MHCSLTLTEFAFDRRFLVAEHDTEARPILVCTDESIAHRVNDRLRDRLSTLPTADTAKYAVEKVTTVNKYFSVFTVDLPL